MDAWAFDYSNNHHQLDSNHASFFAKIVDLDMANPNKKKKNEFQFPPPP